MKVSGLVSKLKQNADLLTAAMSIYQSFGGDLSAVSNHFLSDAWIKEVTWTLSNLGLLQQKLLTGSDAYTQLFKLGLAAYAAGELGLIQGSWKNVGKKVLMGALVSAFVLPATAGTTTTTTSPMMGYTY